MSSITPDGRLDGEPLEDGAALELRLTGDRWIPVSWHAATRSVVLALGGDWEGLESREAPLAIDFDRAEFRRGTPIVRATRLMAITEFLREQAPAVPPEMPDLDVVRAHKQVQAELPRLVEEYQQRFRDQAYDLFRAAARFATVRDPQLVADARAALEEAAVRFEESSRWLAALQMMEADGKQ
jgi:hypothetical protein